ncbi:PIN domain-containing protein [Halovivax limisalsi]|uniref:PIN domain-containing protein n=1 Tax=Halovivax limisalsi TaxID=1453760 RepID=UPI001FFC2A7B|nr:PIN domain-containing protein [Halovivax limisalsi]
MIYVETDFLLALAKRSDWLKDEAEAALEERTVRTSILAYAEFMLVSERYGIDRVRAVSNLVELVPPLPDEHADVVLKAVRYQDAHGLTNFDALHAGMADTWGTPVLGSEGDYDQLAIDRVALEPTESE